MKLISINLGQERTLVGKKRAWQTGIFKVPVTRPVRVSVDGLPEDVICDRKNHGGHDQALSVYGTPDYEWWADQLRQALTPGTFGENLTIEGLESAHCRIGDSLVVGEVILQITSPRIPCNTLATRMKDPYFVKLFRRAERPGLYCRVIREGWLHLGDPVRLDPYLGETVSVLEMFRDYYVPVLDEASLRRYLAAPICARARADKEGQWQKLTSRG
jgi:MOSC domain-containing protein YiiM